MADIRPFRSPNTAPTKLRARSMENWRFIRETMETATSFTAVPGDGAVIIGITALVMSAASWRVVSLDLWIGLWVGEAFVALLIAGWTMDHKARAADVPLFSGPGRKFALSLLPPLVAGALLTPVLHGPGLPGKIPGV